MSKNERNVVQKVAHKVEDVVTKVIDKNPDVDFGAVIIYGLSLAMIIPFFLKFFNIL